MSMTMRQQAIFWGMGVFLFGGMIWLLNGMLLPFVIGLAVAYFLDPLTDAIEKAGVNRTLSTAVVLLSFVAIFALVVALVFPVLQGQLVEFAEALPRYIAKAKAASAPMLGKLRQHFSLLQSQPGFEEDASAYASKAFQWGTGILRQLWDGGLAIVDILSLIIVAPVVSFYMLRDWDAIVKKVDGWLPRQHADVLRDIARQIDATLSGFVRGQATVCLCLGGLYGVALSAMGLNFGFLIGFMAGILSFIPYVGSLIGLLTALGVAWFQFDGVTPMLIVAAIFGVGQFIEGTFLTPKLVGDKIGLHAVWVLFALMAGAHLMGFVGVMIAVPAAAIMGVLARFLIRQYLESSYYGGASMRKKPT